MGIDRSRIGGRGEAAINLTRSLLVDFVGQEVRRDQPILEIFSPEWVATQEELLLASRYREATEKSPFYDVRNGGEPLLSTTKRRLAL